MSVAAAHESGTGRFCCRIRRSDGASSSETRREAVLLITPELCPTYLGQKGSLSATRELSPFFYPTEVESWVEVLTVATAGGNVLGSELLEFSDDAKLARRCAKLF